MPDVYYTVPSAIFSHSASFFGISPPPLFQSQSSSNPSVDPRQMAYFYATISFLFGLIKAQSDLQHLYYSRRAAVRAQSELIGSIYEKSLVRKDITGSVASDALKKATKGSKDTKDKDKDADKGVASADVGKIVSLIATDATQCANVANMLTVSSILYLDIFSQLLRHISNLLITASLRNPNLFHRFLLAPLHAHGLDSFHRLRHFHIRHAYQLAHHVCRLENPKDSPRRPR